MVPKRLINIMKLRRFLCAPSVFTLGLITTAFKRQGVLIHKDNKTLDYDIRERFKVPLLEVPKVHAHLPSAIFPIDYRYMEQEETLKEQTGFGVPKEALNQEHIQKAEYYDYKVYYDTSRGNPLLTYEYIRKDNVMHKGIQRARTKYDADPRVACNDYFTTAGSGYDKSHMAAGRNHYYTEEAYNETFKMTNVSPMVHEVNEGVWNMIEKYVRHKVNCKDVLGVHVFAGAVFKNDSDLGYIDLQRKTKIPTHFYKIFITEHGTPAYNIMRNVLSSLGKVEPEYQLRAFLIPNVQIPSDTPILTFLKPLEEVLEAIHVPLGKDMKPGRILYGDDYHKQTDADGRLSKVFDLKLEKVEAEQRGEVLTRIRQSGAAAPNVLEDIPETVDRKIIIDELRKAGFGQMRPTESEQTSMLYPPTHERQQPMRHPPTEPKQSWIEDPQTRQGQQYRRYPQTQSRHPREENPQTRQGQQYRRYPPTQSRQLFGPPSDYQPRPTRSEQTLMGYPSTQSGQTPMQWQPGQPIRGTPEQNQNPNSRCRPGTRP